jgi:Diaminopimelate epimerase
MRYFNSDGYEGTMCGNGGRCLVSFAAYCGIDNFDFEAIDGFHSAKILKRCGNRDIVMLRMINVDGFDKFGNKSYFLNTGSPHYVEFITGLSDYPVDEKGKYWRHHNAFNGGTNVNFVEFIGSKREIKVENNNEYPIFINQVNVRTYERGVEAETYACGTGITASALSTFKEFNMPEINSNNIAKIDTAFLHCDVQALGDKLCVDAKWNKSSNSFTDIWLTGPATQVFNTEILLPNL